MLSILFIFIISVYLVFAIYSSYCRNGRLISKLPRSKNTLPLLGDVLTIVQPPDVLFRNLRELFSQTGRIAVLHVHYMIQTVFLYEPTDIEKILSTSRFNTKTFPYIFLRSWLAQGLLISNGDKWHQRRKILTPAFHFNILKKFQRTFNDESVEFVHQIQSEVGNEKTDIFPLISKSTVRVMCETAMGSSMDEGIETVTNKYLKSIRPIGESLVYRLVRVWLHPDPIYKLTSDSKTYSKAVKEAQKFTEKIIKERRIYKETHETMIDSEYDDNEEVFGKKGRLAMLDLLLESEKDGNIDNEGIREEVDTFMFEGHDTTAHGLCYFLMSIANEPRVQELLHKEVEKIFGDSRRSPTTDDLSELKYLECCIKETLRLYPSVPSITREVTEDVELSGYTIPIGSIFVIPIFDVHRRPDIFPDPEKFNPERFFPENSVDRHRYAYIPFSAGPRNCIGQKFAMMEMKTILSSVLREFRVEPVTKPRDLVFWADMTLRTKDPIYVRFAKR